MKRKFASKKYKKNIIKIKTNKMKNMMKETQSVVDVVASDGRFKGVSCPVEYGGETYIRKENEMVFYLRENPNCQVYAVGVWYENTAGETIGDVDTYFLHVLSNQRCETVRDCFAGWSEPDAKAEEDWEALCQRIEDLPGIEEIICVEERVEV